MSFTIIKNLNLSGRAIGQEHHTFKTGADASKPFMLDMFRILQELVHGVPERVYTAESRYP